MDFLLSVYFGVDPMGFHHRRKQEKERVAIVKKEAQGVDTLTKNPPTVDSTSFRVTKMRMLPEE
ncbi:MAG: hypothetical protein OSA78_01175 [Flavobacteriales bacterium]|nr:hypothetical protein [Flavobacteriales bacterium]